MCFGEGSVCWLELVVYCGCMGTDKKKEDGVPVVADGDGGLPEQEKFFSMGGLKKKVRAGTQLPDPRRTPEGFDKDKKFRHLFPEVQLPKMFPGDDRVSFRSPDLPPNDLYFGDNLYVLRQIESESIDLIYIDPPFFSDEKYSVTWGDDNEVRSFNDIFQDGMYSYLAWLNARLWEMKRVLKDTGSIYVHCDWHASHYIKTEMDKIFGYDNFINEIVWVYKTGGVSKKHFSRKHDVILYYGKENDKCLFNPQQEKSYLSHKYGFKTIKIEEDEGGIYRMVYCRDVFDIPALRGNQPEMCGYPTQKPLELLERIIKASSNEGDVVADFFMGGGTTGVAALKLGRHFIGCDSSRVAVSVTASRLIDIGEEISGVTVKKKEEQRLEMKMGEVADIRVGYVGNYPKEKFMHVQDEEFRNFVRKIYDAAEYSGDLKNIHGLANGEVILYISGANQEKNITAAMAKEFVTDALRHSERILESGEQRIFQMIGWGFDPKATEWKGKTTKVMNDKGLKVKIDFVPLGEKVFRERVFRNIGDRNIDLKFNRLNDLLVFCDKPYIGEIKIVKQDGLTVHFELPNAKAVGTGKLINCQWDFDFLDGRFANKEHALNRKSDTFEAVLTAEYTFEKEGEYTIAARVQDSLGGEATVSGILEVRKGESFIKIL